MTCFFFPTSSSFSPSSAQSQDYKFPLSIPLLPHLSFYLNLHFYLILFFLHHLFHSYWPLSLLCLNCSIIRHLKLSSFPEASLFFHPLFSVGRRRSRVGYVDPNPNSYYLCLAWNESFSVIKVRIMSRMNNALGLGKSSCLSFSFISKTFENRCTIYEENKYFILGY
jgi:hypothetical protein